MNPLPLHPCAAALGVTGTRFQCFCGTCGSYLSVSTFIAPGLRSSFSLSPPSTEEELTPWGDAAPRSTQDPTQLQQRPLPHTLSRHWSKASCCRRQAGAAAGKGENVIFQFPSDILSGGEQRGFLTAESKAELTGSNIPRSLMLVWVESVNLCLQK